MSGIEAAGLVFGIVPIVIEILKSYEMAKSRFKAFAHHSQVVYDVRLRYRIAATNFGNNCQLLLAAVVDDSRELSAMVRDPSHSAWQDSDLEERFRRFLDQDHELCEEIVVKIRDALRETQAKLSELDRGLAKGKDTSRKLTMQRVYQAFNISLKENQYRQWLDSLDQWNTKLGELRAQRGKLHKHARRNIPTGCVIRRQAPRSYSDICQSAQRLHESLHESWSCSNMSHTGHQAKLSLDAEAEYGAVRLDMAISCRLKEIGATTNLSSEPPIWLHIQSITTKAPEPRPAGMPSALSQSLSSSSSLKTSATGSVESRISSKTARQNLKRVRFDASPDPDETPARPQAKESRSSNALNGTAGQSFAMLDLKTTKSICCHLSRTCSTASPCGDSCLGYLEHVEVPNSFRLNFYDSGRNAAAGAKQQNLNPKACPITGLLQSLHTVHQLTLAHKLASAILQYHSTPWIPQDWALSDIAYFVEAAKVPESDISNELQSLHLSTQFPAQASSTAKLKGNPDEARYLYGIRNMTLAKLGTALIEIGFQKDIGTLNLDPTPHDVIKARKILLNEPTSATLGTRYFNIARKCIECDFSCGDNLNDAGLQSAVYTDVVCALEDMIKGWKKFRGIK